MKSQRLLPFLATALAILLSGQALYAELSVAGVFTKGAILQRDRDIPVWGTASPGSEIAVSLGEVTSNGKADSAGKWIVRLSPMSANAEALSLRISSTGDSNALTLSDILIGDVWICSGQSNMAMTVARSKDPETELASADLPELRVFSVERKASQQPLEQCGGEWVKSSRETAGRFSAIGWFFGREIHREAGIPVGLIVAAWSGSSIEAWTSEDVQKNQPCLQPLLQSWADKEAAFTPDVAEKANALYQEELASWTIAFKAAKEAGTDPPRKPRLAIDPRLHHHHPAVLFNGMISPLIPYAIRGALWYQGETNGLTSESAALYEKQLPLLVNDWRTRWNQGDFPMAWVQLPFVSARQVDWPPVREAMRLAQVSLPNAGMAVTLDLGEERLLHPKNKQAFAHRLALWARSEVYGETIPWSGPLPDGYKIDGSEVIVSFSHATGGLIAKDDSALRGFEVCSKDQKWHPAKASISGNSIRVSSDLVPAPVAVRYAWANHPEANLFNGVDLPASPFQLGDTRSKSSSLQPVAKRAATPAPTHPPLEPADVATLPDGSEGFEIFLLMGQSNMKGRGLMPEKPLRDPRILMMHKRTDDWFLARHPLHLVGDPTTFEGHDNAGVGPGLAFAETLLRHRPETRVGLIPCAAGGTRIAVWKKGGRLYADTIRRAQLALASGPEGKTRIAGALWLQGESDSTEERVALYAEALAELVTNLRSDLAIEDLPFLVSTIGEMKGDIEQRKAINAILLDLPNQVPGTAAVDARDLTGHIGDLVHLDTVSQNEIGRRFARLFLQLPAVRGK